MWKVPGIFTLPSRLYFKFQLTDVMKFLWCVVVLFSVFCFGHTAFESDCAKRTANDSKRIKLFLRVYWEKQSCFISYLSSRRKKRDKIHCVSTQNEGNFESIFKSKQFWSVVLPMYLLKMFIVVSLNWLWTLLLTLRQTRIKIHFYCVDLWITIWLLRKDIDSFYCIKFLAHH